MRSVSCVAWLVAVSGISAASILADRIPPSLSLTELRRDALLESRVALPEARLPTSIGLGPEIAFRPQTVLLKMAGDRHVSVLAVPAGQENDAVKLLRSRSDVAFAEVDARMQRQGNANDSLLAQQWHHAQIGSAEAWEYAPGSPATKIAIVDTPYQMNHPDLDANTENGWDVVNDTMVTSAQVPGVYAFDDHATAAAGMAAAVVNNALGVAGAGNCRMLPIRINGFISEMYNATLWAASNNVRIVNISWDGAYSATLNDAGRFLREQADGILVMAGVNGSGRLDYTNHPYITCVSMTDSNDALRSHSGPHIDFSAPGWDVLTTRTISGYATTQGTSFSAPLVSGVLGALLAVAPTLSAADALAALRRSALDLGSPGWDEQYGWGRIDFGTAAWLSAVGVGQNPGLVIRDIKAGTNTVVAVDYHRGLQYQLEHTSGLCATNWMALSMACSPQGGLMVLSGHAIKTSAYFRVTGSFP